MATTHSQRPVRMEYTHTTSVKTTSLGLADLVIKHSRCPWFHQKAVALVALIRLIYLFMILLYYTLRVKGNVMLMCICVSPSGYFLLIPLINFRRNLMGTPNVTVTSLSLPVPIPKVTFSNFSRRQALYTGFCYHRQSIRNSVKFAVTFIPTHYSPSPKFWTLYRSELTYHLRVVNHRRHKSSGSHDGTYAVWDEFILTFLRKMMPPSARRLN
jgi:hypothetical protein